MLIVDQPKRSWGLVEVQDRIEQVLISVEVVCFCLWIVEFFTPLMIVNLVIGRNLNSSLSSIKVFIFLKDFISNNLQDKKLCRG